MTDAKVDDTSKPDDYADLYRRAFAVYGTQALWNMRATENPTLGYVLHPVDLATNKAAAAADGREPRDIVDLVTIHEKILPLGASVSAAIGRFPGQSPEEMLADITRHSRFDAEEFRVLAMDHPLDVPGFHRRVSHDRRCRAIS